jgi:hypothetical protein
MDAHVPRADVLRLHKRACQARGVTLTRSGLGPKRCRSNVDYRLVLLPIATYSFGSQCFVIRRVVGLKMDDFCCCISSLTALEVVHEIYLFLLQVLNAREVDRLTGS